MIDKIIRFLFYILFLATPLLMYKNTSELFEFNKMIFIYLIASLIFTGWIIKVKVEKKFIFKRTLLDLPISIFLASQILSTIFSIDRYTSFFGFYGRFNGGLLSTITYIFLYYAFVNLFDFKKVITLLKTSLLSSFLVILWSLPGKFGYDLSCWIFLGDLNNNCWVDQFNPAERLFSTLGQPNWLGAFLAINFFIALYFLIKNKSKKLLGKQFLVYGGFLALSFIVILFTRSRSSLLALIAGVVLFVGFYIVKNGFQVFKKTLLDKKLIFLVSLLLISLFVFKTGISKIDTFLSFESLKQNTKIVKNEQKVNEEENINITGSVDIRKIVWKGAWELGLKYPFFGSGVETFAYSYYFTRPSEHNLTSEWDFIYNKAHNEYLNFLATTGFIGLIAYLFLIGSALFIFYKLIKKSSKHSEYFLYLCLLCSYVTILVTNFFGFSTTTINLFFFIIPAFLGIEIIRKQKEIVFKNTTSNYIGIIGALLGIYFLFFISAYYIADLYYSKAEKLAKAGDYQLATQFIENSIKLHKSHVYSNFYALNLANLAVLASYQKDNTNLKQLMDFSLQQSNEAIAGSSKNVSYLKNKSKIEYLLYQLDNTKEKYLNNAIASLVKAQEISPTDPKIPYSLSIFYSILYDQTKDIKYKKMSLDIIDYSIKLKSNYRDGYFLKAQLLEKFGEINKAKKALNYILKNIDSKDKEAKEYLNSL